MISVIGLGYIGLPTALMLAANGNEVIGTDKSEEVVDSLNMGKLTFSEEGLEDLFQQAVSNEITFTTKYPSSDVYIIAVPTPYDKTSKRVDMCYIASAFNSILEV